jgi:aromatic ring-opening dioxygenase catalytic subunit (LigB family)
VSGARLPTLYIPHGGGPCFFMDWTMGPADTWDRMADWLRSIGPSLPRRPDKLLVISAHWEKEVPTVIRSKSPPLLYDYSGFPKSTYELTWPAPGAPELAERVSGLLSSAGIASAETTERGNDHGVFIPLKVAFPEAEFPTVQLSLQAGLDPRSHLAIGRALAPLRDEGVLIIGSGMSFHNMRTFMTAAAKADSEAFDDWLSFAVADTPAARDQALEKWTDAPRARACHPREEHLLPLMVAAGAAGKDLGQVVFRDFVMGSTVSAVRFG